MVLDGLGCRGLNLRIFAELQARPFVPQATNTLARPPNHNIECSRECFSF